MSEKRIRIITGHFGSGKTEFAMNYAMKLKEKHDKVSIVDLDVINMYFRIREEKELIEDTGIEIFSSLVKGNSLDLPALDPAILKPINNKEYQVILDVGGNPSGARALGRYHNLMKEEEYDHFFVVNRNRLETSTAEQVIDFIKRTEDTSKTKVTGLVNTTHMLKDTSVEDILYGQELVEEVSKILDIPVVYVVAIDKVAQQLKEYDFYEKVFPIKMYFRSNWMV